MNNRMMKYLSAISFSLLLSSFVMAQQKPEYNYLPPEWAKNVVFYHSFEKGLDQPEINLTNLKVGGEKKNIIANGLTGQCYKSANTNDKGNKAAGLIVSGPGVAVHHPITIMCWFRLDQEPAQESCYELLQLCGKAGWISTFVRGKGEWCGLSKPTRISQCHDFPGIANVNNPWSPDPVTFKKGEWHNAAISVANASTVCMYWDGVLKETISIKGRDFREDDVTFAQFDSNPFYFPTSVDELVVANVVLTGQQIADYVKAVQALTSVSFPPAAINSGTKPEPAPPAK